MSRDPSAAISAAVLPFCFSYRWIKAGTLPETEVELQSYSSRRRFGNRTRRGKEQVSTLCEMDPAGGGSCSALQTGACPDWECSQGS